MVAKLIKTDADYEAALERISDLMGVPAGTPDADELELLTHLVEMYEELHYPIPLPDPIEAIRFRMDQQGLKQADLVPYLGSRSKVSEVLSGKRPLSLAMIRKLHAGLGIPAEVLIGEPGAVLPAEFAELDWAAFPAAEMVKRGWFAGVVESGRELLARAEEILGPFLTAAGPMHLQTALARQHVRQGSEANEHALWAWRARVAQLAHGRAVAEYHPEALDEQFLSEVARLSQLDEGPRLAAELLAKAGICMVVERHLPKTHLDGAALQFEGLPPVVALTLRHDRIDSFWFTVCHELAHVLLHFGADDRPSFVDDLDATDVSKLEAEADVLASRSLIPDADWAGFTAQGAPTPASVRRLARRLRVHPGIVAGRYRRETGNYTVFSDLVGNGQVRRLFEQP